ncbi:ATP-binding protein [Myroides sp. M-43]|uniref:ATP-binding protein n=1 Tax=Myroides oncorhynchi TaxID=2893756 RepID=UPI001E2D0A82|nr:tetratricopeptide repeat-containing sensor histidine kinase [Myroides oncorhynchi]MCC9044229.1 ATP-binding protein [Myroides oncorhynchi]
MKRLRQINFLLVVIALVFVNCTRSHIDSKTDYDQLYAVWHDYDYKDSLADVLRPAVENALTLSNTPDNRVTIDSVLSHLRWTRDSISFFKLSNKAIKYAKSKSDQYMLAGTYNNIAMYYHDLNVLDSTFYYYIKTENIYNQLGDSIKIGEMEFYQARLLLEKGLYMESEVKTSNALSILKNHPLNPIPFEANQLMALCLIERKDYSEAKVYLIRALELMQKDIKSNKVLNKDRLMQAITAVYINLSEVSFYLGKYKESLDYADVAFSYIEPEFSSLIIGYAKATKARAGFMLELKYKYKVDVDKYAKEIEKTFIEALDVNNYYIANTMAMMVADMFFQAKELDKAFRWAEKAYAIALERDMKPLQREALEFLVIHKEYENRDQVKEVIRLTHVLDELDYMTRNRFARIEYETQKIEFENVELKGVISILFITSVSIILALMLGVYIYRLKNKTREIKLIKGQQAANESIYELILEKSSIATEVKNNVRNKIAKDLHDGVVNGIFTIRFNLQQLNSDNETLKNTLISELQHLEKGTRDISHSLIDNELFKETKFLSLVEDLVSLQKNKWNTKFLLDYQGQLNLEDLSAIDKVNTYFIIREAIHNVNKYSKASLCTISFIGNVNETVIKIKDNGIGFDVEAKSGGMGLQNMNERALSLHSEIVIFSEKEVGTEVYFKVTCQEVSSN